MSFYSWMKGAWYDWRQGMNVNPNEIPIIGYPKCGNTWYHFMVIQGISKAYDVDLGLTIESTKVTKEHEDIPTILWTHDKSMILTEGGIQLDPKVLFSYGQINRWKKNRVIFLTRDPRDVIVSHYWQTTKRSQIPMEFKNMSEFIRHPYLGFDRIIRWYDIWDKNWNVPKDIIHVTYEDLMLNGVSTLKKSFEYIGIDQLSTKDITEIYEFSSADNMRKLEKKSMIKGLRSFGKDKNAQQVRKAKIGNYVEEMTKEDVEFCNEKMKEIPSRYGYEK